MLRAFQRVLRASDALQSETLVGTQSSFVIILSLVATMLGSPLLAIPWGFNQSGFAGALVTLTVTALLAFSTCWLIIRHTLGELVDPGYDAAFLLAHPEYVPLKEEVSTGMIYGTGGIAVAAPTPSRVRAASVMAGSPPPSGYGNSSLSLLPSYTRVAEDVEYELSPEERVEMSKADFVETCRGALGLWGQWVATGATLVLVSSTLCVSAVLMSSSLSAIVKVALLKARSQREVPHWWNDKVAAAIALTLVFPLTLLKQSRILVTLSSFGFISVAYNIFFICYMSIEYTSAKDGHFPAVEPRDLPRFHASTFFQFAGVLLASFMVHNVALIVVRQHHRPRKIKRDLFIAFAITTLVYCALGLIALFGYYGSPVLKYSNFLRGFYMGRDTHNLTAICHVFILLQMLVTFPLFLGTGRSQFFLLFPTFGGAYPSTTLVCSFNFVVTALAGLVAAFSDGEIGFYLRAGGCIGGFAWIFLLPVLVHWTATKYSLKSIFVYAPFIVVGLVVIVGQFVN
jgi:amino acid permease